MNSSHITKAKEAGRPSSRAFIALAILSASFLACTGTQGFAASGWYDYGNGLINLATIKYINGDMSIMTVADAGEAYEAYTARCSRLASQLLINVSITADNAAEIVKIAAAATEAKCAWQTSATIKFDDFTLTLPSYSSAEGDTASEATDDYVSALNDVKQHL